MGLLTWGFSFSKYTQSFESVGFASGFNQPHAETVISYFQLQFSKNRFPTSRSKMLIWILGWVNLPMWKVDYKVKSYQWIFNWVKVRAHPFHVVQGSTVLYVEHKPDQCLRIFWSEKGIFEHSGHDIGKVTWRDAIYKQFLQWSEI